MSTVVWDLDNCLSDDSWRLDRIDWTETDAERRYAAYHTLCYHDDPGNLDVWLDWVRLGAAPLFITGRPERVRTHTVAWIRRHLCLPSPRVLMRRPGDNRPSAEVKRDLLLSANVRLSEIVAAYDDHAPVLDVYRAFGLQAHHLSIHSRCAYTVPILKEQQ